jgi:large subunit ribosomal protein L32
MAVPFHRTSKTRKNKRRTHFKLTVTGLITCSNCGKLIRSHTVCPSCGFYAKKQVIQVGEPVKTAPVEAAKTKAKKVKKAGKVKAETPEASSAEASNKKE